MALLDSFGLRYVNGDLPPFFYKVWGSVATTGLFKNGDKDTIRPLGVKSSLLRDLHKGVATKTTGPLNDFLLPQQLALQVSPPSENVE